MFDGIFTDHKVPSFKTEMINPGGRYDAFAVDHSGDKVKVAPSLYDHWHIFCFLI